MSETIDYGNLMHRAMRGLIQEVLENLRQNGLPGEHHFFITFDTTHPDVEIADWLADRYPEEMTIVIQHWFADLEVTDKGFSITLNFGDNPEPLYVPFDSLRTFVDPSVEFGLRFETQDSDDNTVEGSIEPTAIPKVSPKDPKASEDGPKQGKKQDAEVVSLDSFRK